MSAVTNSYKYKNKKNILVAPLTKTKAFTSLHTWQTLIKQVLWPKLHSRIKSCMRRLQAMMIPNLYWRGSIIRANNYRVNNFLSTRMIRFLSQASYPSPTRMSSLRFETRNRWKRGRRTRLFLQTWPSPCTLIMIKRWCKRHWLVMVKYWPEPTFTAPISHLSW